MSDTATDDPPSVGTGAPGGASEVSGRRPRPAWRRYAWWLGVLVSVAVLAVGVTVGVRGWLHDAGPEGTVRGYFSALQRADAPTALAYGSLPEGSHTLLTSTVLRAQQQLAPLRNMQVGAVRERGSRASVPVRYDLDFPAGTQHVSATLALHRDGDDWRLAQSAVTTELSLQQAGALASVAGTSGVPVPSGTVAVFPGAVPVHFATPYLQLDAGSGATWSVGFGGAAVSDLRARASSAGHAAVLAAVTKALRRCVTHTDVSCPLPSGRYVPGSLRGHIVMDQTPPPTVTVGQSTGGQFEVFARAKFTGSYRRLTFDDRERTRHGTFALDVDASAYAVAPLRVTWASS